MTKGTSVFFKKFCTYVLNVVLYKKKKKKRKFNNFDWSRNLNISKVKIVTKSEGLNFKYIGFK